jgi:hypothetical protein
MFLTNDSLLVALVSTAVVCGVLFLCSFVKWLGPRSRRRGTNVQRAERDEGKSASCPTGAPSGASGQAGNPIFPRTSAQKCNVLA